MSPIIMSNDKSLCPYGRFKYQNIGAYKLTSSENVAALTPQILEIVQISLMDAFCFMFLRRIILTQLEIITLRRLEI